MPPKGWRKNADGNYPVPSRDTEITSIDEILFPRSIVQRLAKEMLIEDETNMSMAKDSLIALQRSATVFVSHIIFHARKISGSHNRKTVNAQDILAALERADYSGFVPQIKEKLTSFEATAEAKKQAKSGTGEDSNKRMKTNDSSAVGVETNEEGSDEDVTNDNDNTEELNDEQEPEEQEPEEPEITQRNPIEAFSKEEDELEGSKIEPDAVDPVEVEDDEE